MVGYLALLQLLPAFALWGNSSGSFKSARLVVVSQCLLLIIFMLAWGGYGKDSWDYLPRFDALTEDDTAYDSEWLFWAIGVLLGQLVYDPWPLKILSGISVTGLCVSYFFFLKDRNALHLAIALFVLAIVPAYYFLVGSAVRQGLAGTLVVLGTVLLSRGKLREFFAISIAAVFIHHSAVIFSAAALVTMVAKHRVIYLFVLAPLVGYLGIVIANALGIDIKDYIPYSGKSEGVYHYEKFVIAYLAASIALLLTKRSGVADKYLVRAYACMVGVSALFLPYEITAERLLAFSELLLPLVVAVSVIAIGWTKERLAVLWLIGWLSGFGLWLHPSITETLGYTTI